MPVVPFARFESDILELYAPPLCKAATARQVRQVLREFRELPGVRKTSDLNPVAIARWVKAHPDRSAVTVQSLLRCLGPLLGYAVAQGHLKSSPLKFRGPSKWVKDNMRPVGKPHPGSRSIGEMTAVLDRADLEADDGGWEARRLRALIYIYAYLGLRAGEALHLWVADVDLAESCVTVRRHLEDGYTPKTLESEAVLPITPQLADVLRGWIAEADTRWLFPGAKRKGPWISGGAGAKPLDKIKALGARAGVADLTISSFRKTVGTYAKTWGLGPLELKAILRHTNTKTQDWYNDQSNVDSKRPGAAKVVYPRIAG